MVVSGTGPNSMRTQREAMVIRSCGTKSASTMNIVEAGGSSSVFNRRAAPSALSRWNSSSTITWRSPSTGAREAMRMISVIWSLSSEAPTRRTSRTSGCSPARANRPVRLWADSSPASSRAAKARAATSLVLPGGPTKR